MNLLLAGLSISCDTAHPWLLIAIGIGALALVIWGYRRTVPAISRGWRIVLTVLRGLAVLLIILIALKLVITLEREITLQPELALVIDQSASIGLKDGLGERKSALAEVLSGDNRFRLDDIYRLRYFHFSDSVREVTDWDFDSLDFTGTATDIALAVAQAGTAVDIRGGALLLLTDGAYNVGESPARAVRRSPVPVFIVGIGDSTPPVDLSIDDIRVNPLVYEGDEVPVEVTVSGYEGGSSVLKLVSPAGKVIDRKKVNFSGGGNEARVKFNFTVDSAGIRTYSLSLDLLENESIADNNRRHFSVKALRSRMNVLLIAGAPGSDFAFLNRILENNSDIQLSSMVERSGGGFYHRSEPLELDNFDLFIFLNYPTGSSGRDFLSRLIQSVRDGKPLALVPGNNFRGGLLRSLEHLLPAEFGSAGEEIPIKLAPAAELSPLTAFFPDNIDWSGLPPIRTYRGQVNFRPSAAIVAETEEGAPAAGFNNIDGVKILGLAVHDLWRLSLQDPEHSHSDSLITGFWHNAVRWLSTREEEELFRVSTGERVFSSGSRVRFQARLYDKSYRPLEGASVKLEIMSPGGNLPLDLNPSGRGEYLGETSFIEAGAYRYLAFAAAGGDTIKAVGEFTVESFNQELVDPVMRSALLQSAAQSGGGSFYLPGEFERFFEEHSPEARTFVERKEVRIFPRWWSLAIVIFLLSLEWFIRKRKGML